MRLRVSRIPRSTPLGRRAGLIGIGFLFAGFNTGNNLFYLIFTVMASCEVMGFLLARRILRRADVELDVPPRARASAPLRAVIRVTNGDRRLPLPALVWRLRAASGEETEIRTPALAAKESGTGTGRIVPGSRGWLAIARVEARTDFPVGLARTLVRLHGEMPRILVTPRPMSGRTGRIGSRRGDLRSTARPKGPGEEPLEAREYRPGDDARHLDWKASARTERLMWRDRRGDPPRAIRVRLDRSGAGGPEFERRVSRAAGAVIDSLARGDAVGFASDEIEILPRSGPSQRRRILEYLALVRPRGAVAAGEGARGGSGGGAANAGSDPVTRTRRRSRPWNRGPAGSSVPGRGAAEPTTHREDLGSGTRGARR